MCLIKKMTIKTNKWKGYHDSYYTDFPFLEEEILLPWQVFQSSSRMKPSGQRQNTRPMVERQVWEHPALLTLQGPASWHVWLSGDRTVSCRPSQEHSYPPMVFRHVSWQGPCPLFNRHSLISTWPKRSSNLNSTCRVLLYISSLNWIEWRGCWSSLWLIMTNIRVERNGKWCKFNFGN